MPVRVRTVAALCATFVVATACINVFWRTEVTPLDPKLPGGGRLIRAPLKVHLVDGSTVLFRDGARVSSRQISGLGVRYALMSEEARVFDAVPMDSVVALEAFEGKVLAAPTLVVSAAATAGGVFATAVIMVAIFGSCPTIYADTGTGPILEAEGFSYAIAPLFEHRDVDRLRARPGQDGVLRLELRNEALETHYINHVELAAARHERGTIVLPDQASKVLAVGDLRALSAATDRAGRDIRGILSRSDGELYSTAPAIAAAARSGDLNDWIDLEAGDLPAGDSIVVVLRLRNSLLNTVLLYDEMLSGPDAIDWLNNELLRISTALDLTRWYTRTMGLHAIVPSSDAGLETAKAAARLNDVGPLAFRDVAMILPRPISQDGKIRVRLRFVADNWRIDYAAIAGSYSRPSMTMVPITRVVVPVPARGGPALIDSAAADALARADDRYLETRPGQRMTLEFAPPAFPQASTEQTTYLIAWQGWYREWIRRQWIAQPSRTTAFAFGDSSLVSAMRKWRARQPEFERAFYATRIPVR